MDGDAREVAAVVIPARGVPPSMFAAGAIARVCEPGEAIFRALEMGAEMYVVLEGEVELTIGTKTVERLGPGEPFGEMALIGQAPRTAAVAKTACTLAVIPEKRFLFTVQTTPTFALMKVMADRLRKMNEGT